MTDNVIIYHLIKIGKRIYHLHCVTDRQKLIDRIRRGSLQQNKNLPPKVLGIAYKEENFTVQLPHQDEPQHYVLEVKLRYLSAAQVGGIIISASNITDTVRFNQKLKDAKESADLANKAKSECLATKSAPLLME